MPRQANFAIAHSREIAEGLQTTGRDQFPDPLSIVDIRKPGC